VPPVAANGISVALLRPLAELLGRLDVDPPSFLTALGVEPDTAPSTYVAADHVDAALAEIAATRRDPAFALTLAKTAAIRPLGLFGHMVWTSGTVRDAITRAARFYAMVTRRSLIVLDGNLLRHQPAVPGAPRGRILTEFPLVSFALRAREATNGTLVPRAVRFAHAGTSTAAYRDVFGVPVSFAAGTDELELDPAHLDLPLASSDPITSAVLEERVAQLAASPADRNPFLDRVRRAAAEVEGTVTLAAIAKRLATSERTLRRRLEQEGTSLRAVTDDARRERADALLAAGSSVKETAFALGFSEPSAFSRAYKRWTGTSPRPK
jgi:AraC-like DNA-binding protein